HCCSLMAVPVSYSPAGLLIPDAPPTALAPLLLSGRGTPEIRPFDRWLAYGVKRTCANTLAWICDLLTGPNILESRLLPRLSPATKYIPSGSTICLKSPQS